MLVKSAVLALQIQLLDSHMATCEKSHLLLTPLHHGIVSVNSHRGFWFLGLIIYITSKNAVAILLLMSFYPCRLFSYGTFVVGQF